MKCFCRSTYNHVKTDVSEKHIYLSSQYDELLAVSVQIHNTWTRQSNIPYDKFEVFPILLHFFRKFENQQ